jgi:hypothetical protein
MVCAAAAPAGALVRVGGGASGSFVFPSAAFDHDAKSTPGGSLRLYVNAFHWLTFDAGLDVHLPFSAESDTGVGETRLRCYKAGLIYKVHMGIFKPYLSLGYLMIDQRIRRDDGWDDVSAPGFYVGPGLEYYFTERFSANGMMGYNRAFDGARRDEGRDTQYIRVDFGVNYTFW